ncbi:2-octaprenyl-6-methoxyphenol hydroxylase [Limnobacter thiooxidans]|uniref:UbiH/UbiF/VisC/COQ6 family ubiquinone biosynthesis hydroxylase n=1 Tax=Limnobacter thiooxidans TaxID=131080 RepID=A0AA86MHI2_9BURK|nr:2-octaprenyl-6-methoxyphenol hydroxylase [Limnobacter thiooxidans]BET25152.1 UbiH/UbiF/VisC/COQ6 family ubiquinone biosynthesis hydroxylase [Limnobacter thiooxidans]
MTSHTDFDVAIVGAGPVGLAFAGWLANAWGDRANRIAIFDAKPLQASAQDPRILALSDATRLRLGSLAFPSNATPIHHIHVSEQSRFGQVRMKADELGLRALGWTVRYGELVTCLSDSLERRGVKIFRPANVKYAHRSAVESLEVLELEDGTEFTVGLRVDAEGGLYGEAGERDQVVDYGQWALVSEVVLNVEPGLLSGSNTLAFERFTSEGPLALLPISTDQRKYSLVWCAPLETVQRRLACSEHDFSSELRQQFGRRISIEHIGPRKSFPLGMNWRDKLVQGRRVAIGNAAQILHPVAGQGLNLGLRDAMQLCRSIDPSTVAVEHRLSTALHDFEKSRVADRQVVVKMTDWMVKGFSNHNPLLGAGRQMALNVMEFTPPLRKQFAELMLFGLAV